MRSPSTASTPRASRKSWYPSAAKQTSWLSGSSATSGRPQPRRRAPRPWSARPVGTPDGRARPEAPTTACTTGPCAGQRRAPRRARSVRPDQPRVVPGGDARQPERAGEAGERRQAHGIAVDAGVGRLAAEVAALERVHDSLFELGLEVEDVMGKPELRGGTGGALQSTGRAAAAPVRPGPQPRRRRLEAAALVDQPQRRDGAIDPAAQCDECSRSFGSALRICSTSASRPLFTR